MVNHFWFCVHTEIHCISIHRHTQYLMCMKSFKSIKLGIKAVGRLRICRHKLECVFKIKKNNCLLQQKDVSKCGQKTFLLYTYVHKYLELNYGVCLVYLWILGSI